MASQQGREVGVGLKRPVEVPEHRALQVFGPLVDVLVERDLVDAALSFVLGNGAERLGDRDLLLVGDVESAEEDDAALFERRPDVLRFCAAEQGVEVGSDLAADSRGEVDDVQFVRR